MILIGFYLFFLVFFFLAQYLPDCNYKNTATHSVNCSVLWGVLHFDLSLSRFQLNCLPPLLPREGSRWPGSFDRVPDC